MSQVWFITGCSSGFGAGLALLALKSGHKVIATSRNPSATPELVKQVEELGGTWLALDVCSPEVPKIMQKAIGIHGRIDVLVNNAGYSLLGAVEDLSEEECQQQMQTNFFAPLKIIQLVLPSMRERKSGTIANISSVAGIDALPSTGLYAASKHALEAMSESLSQEIAPFNIRVLLIEPGGFRTKFLDGYKTPAKGLTAAYKGTAVDVAMQKFKEMAGKQRGDTNKACKVMYDFIAVTGVAAGKERFLRLILGPDCAARVRAKAESLLETLEGLKDVLGTMDHEVQLD